MQGLRSPQHGRQRLDRHAHHVVFGLLCRERRAPGLRVESQPTGRVVGLKLLLHETGPQTSRRAELGDFFEQVGERGEEKGQARRELIEVQSHGQRPPHVLEAVRERERHLLRRRRARLPHVIARHGDRIDAQALDRDEPAHVDREAQRRLDRIDVRAARDELLEDVVLDGALQLAARHPLLLPHHHVHREQHGRRRVDGHGRGHTIERNAVEQARQIVYRVDRHSGAAHLPLSHGMVRVVPHLCREIERDRQPRLTRREQMLEPRVRLLRGPEPGVLSHGPQLAAIHRGMHAPGERKRARSAELARRLGAPVVGTVDRLAVAHLAPTAASAERIRAANATSSLLPITSGVF